MDIDHLSQSASRAMATAVLRHVEAAIKRLRPDTTAIAPEHVAGFEAGFRACKRDIFDILADD